VRGAVVQLGERQMEQELTSQKLRETEMTYKDLCQRLTNLQTSKTGALRAH
jgi:hypothetical protein